MDAGLTRALSSVPTGKRGQAAVTFTRQGIEAAVGVKVWKGLSAGGYATRAWGHKGYAAGARVAFAW